MYSNFSAQTAAERPQAADFRAARGRWSPHGWPGTPPLSAEGSTGGSAWAGVKVPYWFVAERARLGASALGFIVLSYLVCCHHGWLSACGALVETATLTSPALKLYPLPPLSFKCGWARLGNPLERL